MRYAMLFFLSVSLCSWGQSLKANTILAPGAVDHASVLALKDCYSDQYSSAKKFLEHRLSRFPGLADRPDGQERQVALYEYLNSAREGVDCAWMKYAVDGFQVHGFIAAPEGAAEGDGEYPVVVVLRGGNADSGRGSLRRLAAQVFPLVREGFVVIGTSYRGAAVSPREPHPDRLADQFGGDDLNDVFALLPIIDSAPFADGDRIGLWGNSRGAMMGFMAVREADRFSAMVGLGAPVDLEKELAFRPEMEERVLSVWIPDFEENREEALKQRSVIHWAEELSDNTAIFLAHGTNDQRVRPEGVLELALRFQALGRDYQLVMYEGGDHSLHGHGDDVLERIRHWFKTHLH